MNFSLSIPVPSLTLICALAPLAPHAFGTCGDPADIPGNVAWFDGSDPDGDGVLGGGFLNGRTWVDRSAMGNANATMNMTNRRPKVIAGAWNNQSIVRFDGNDYMDASSACFSMLNGVQGATFFAVASTTATSSQRLMMVSTGTGSKSTRAGVNMFDAFGTSIGGSGDYGAAGRRLDSDSFQRIEGGTITMGQLEQYCAVYDYSAGDLALYVDGQLATLATNFQTPGSTSPTNSINIRLGADADLAKAKGFFRGDLAELIVYNRVLSSTERAIVEAYLHAKWFAPSLGNSFCSPIVPNSTGLPGTIRARGSALVSDNDVTVIAEQLPPNEFGYFIVSQWSGFFANPGGSQGNLCLSGTIGRYGQAVASSGQNGMVLLPIDLSAMPPPVQSSVLPGDTWHFQLWHRDKNPTSTSNFTDGVAILFF